MIDYASTLNHKDSLKNFSDMSNLKDKVKSDVDSKQQLKRDQELYNPCWKEHNLGLKCLNDNNYDHDKCQLYFENYKCCKTFWGRVMKYRNLHNIKPALPLPEDREKVKEEYVNSLNR